MYVNNSFNGSAHLLLLTCCCACCCVAPPGGGPCAPYGQAVRAAAHRPQPATARQPGARHGGQVPAGGHTDCTLRGGVMRMHAYQGGDCVCVCVQLMPATRHIPHMYAPQLAPLPPSGPTPPLTCPPQPLPPLPPPPSLLPPLPPLTPLLLPPPASCQNTMGRGYFGKTSLHHVWHVNPLSPPPTPMPEHHGQGLLQQDLTPPCVACEPPPLFPPLPPCQNTMGRGYFSKTSLHHVWCVNRHNEDSRFALHDQLGNRKLLWHGTKCVCGGRGRA